MKFRASPNFNERPSPIIDTLVLHYTGMARVAEALDRLCDPSAEVSCHYLVEQDGTVWRLVDEARRAWHAGVSFWRGRRNLNDCSIGIEIDNPGHEWGYVPFPDVQISSVIALCRDILGRHPISARNVVAHGDIAPSRKQDPGEKFPWELLAANGVGIWVSESTQQDSAPQQALLEIGYDPEERVEDVIRAFQRHWHPCKVDGVADAVTVGKIIALARQVREERPSFSEEKEAKRLQPFDGA